MQTRRELLTGGACLAAATAAWSAAAPRVFTPSLAGVFTPEGPLPAWALALVERHLRVWEQDEPDAITRMRVSNPEWDLMGRTFVVLTLANLALRRPADAPRYLDVIETIIRATCASADRDPTHFLLPYAHRGSWQRTPTRSLFVDGELAMMLAAFELVSPDSPLREVLTARVALVSAQMRAGPVLSAESYPDECWTFCNTSALAGLRMAAAAGVPTDEALPGEWLRSAQRELTHASTGLLVSSYRWGGEHLDGPEGSSIWMSAHNLLLLDPAFARAQYEQAHAALAGSFLGFAYAAEWPDEARGPVDVDSGPVVPVLDASPGSSGLAILAARAFADEDTLARLLASIGLVGFPRHEQGALRHRASNQLGDAILSYAMCFGPLWARVQERLA